jgi:hypothetical protein
VKIASTVSALFLCLSYSVIAQQPKLSIGNSISLSDLHGTVNIVLANKNGAVALTDSMLTSDIPPDISKAPCAGTISEGRFHMPCGQKPFKLNDHTVLTVAGFYSTLGPIDELNAYAPNEVAKAIGAGSPATEIPISIPLDTISRRIADTFEFDLTGILNDYRENNISVGIEKVLSQMIVVGYDIDGSLKIERKETSIFPNEDQGEVKDDRQFTSRRYPITVKDKLIFVTGGMDDVANSVLMYPEQFGSRYESIKRYSESMQRDQGNSLSVADLRALAIDIEAMTAEKHAEVGGSVQVALLSGGRVAIDSELKNPLRVATNADHLMVEGTTVGPAYFSYDPVPNGSLPPPSFRMFKMNASKSVIFYRDRLQDRTQVLDNNAFYESSFSNCFLVFKGGAFKLKNVTVTNSVIVLLRPKDIDDPKISYLLRATRQLRLASPAERNKVLESINLEQYK